MNNTFISPVIGRASELGVSLYEDSDRLELLPNADPEEKEILNREQKAKIQQLKQKLAELSPLANLGAASLNKWQSKGVAGTSITTNNLPSKVFSQEQIIANLEVKVADAQRLASFAETRH